MLVVPLLLLIILTSLNLFSIVNGTNVNGQWQLYPQSFTMRDRFDAACMSDRIVIFGGRSPTDEPTNSVFMFTPEDQQWREQYGAASVKARSGHSFTSAGGEMFVFGGQDSDGNHLQEVAYFSRQSREWVTILDTQKMPEARSRMGSTTPSPNKIVYFMGITRSWIESDVWEFNAMTYTWRPLNHYQSGFEPRFDPCCAYHSTSGHSFCFGGTTEEKDLNEIIAFNHVTDQWVTVSVGGSLPTPRRSAMCSIVNDTFVMWGGYDSEVSKFSSTTLYTLNLTTSFPQTAPSVWIARDHPTVPKTRASGKMCLVENYGLYVFGGSENDKFNDIWQIDFKQNFEFIQIQSNTLLPDRRSGHNAVILGSHMYIMFGKNGDGLLNDMWYLDMSGYAGHTNGQSFSQNTDNFVTNYFWEKVTPRGVMPVGRYGAAASAGGKLIYVFGGITSSTSTKEKTNDLIVFDIVSLVWSTIQLSTGSTVPKARAFHKMTTLSNGYLFVFGGETNSKTRSNDMLLYDPKEQVWGVGTNGSSSIPSARTRFGLSIDPATDEMLLFGGLGAWALSDRWSITNIREVNSSAGENYIDSATGESYDFLADFEKLTSITESGGMSRSYIRGEAAIAGYGSHYIICGGSISLEFPARDFDSCYEWDRASGKNYRMPLNPSYVTGYLSTAVYYSNQVIIFGGQLSRNTLKRPGEYISVLQIFKFMRTCELGSANDTTCAHCSPGTINPSCLPTSAGTYASVPYEPASECGPGSYGDIVGAQSSQLCNPCEAGTYNAKSGVSSCEACPVNSTCHIGATYPQAKSQGATESMRFSQPGEYSQESIPDAFFIAIGCFAGLCLLVLLILTCARAGSKKKLLNYFINDEAEEQLRKVYDECASVTTGNLTEATFFNAVIHPSLNATNFSPQDAVRIFNAHDEDGTGGMEFDEFLDAICDVISDGMLPPFAGTKAFEEGIISTKDRSFISKFSFKNFDSYIGEHIVGKTGDPMKIQRTNFGGTVAILFKISLVIVTCLLLVVFSLQNTLETRSALPAVLEVGSIRADINIQVTLFGRLDFTNNSETGKLCVASGTGPDNHTGTCASDNIVSAGNTLTVGESATETKRCVAKGQTCTIIYFCGGCTLQSTSTILVEFGSLLSATRIMATLQTSTGVSDYGEPHELSESVWDLEPSANTSAFRGSPSTIVSARASQVHFTSFKNSWDQTEFSQTGYVLKTTGFTRGHEVNDLEFPHYYGVPVTFSISLDETTLVLTRQPLQTILQLITSLLGAVSGLAGLAVFIVHFVDKRQNKAMDLHSMMMADEERANAKTEEIRVTPSGTFTELSPERLSQDRKLLNGLLKQNMPFGVAYEHLRLIRAVAEEEKGGVIIGKEAVANTASENKEL